MPSIQRRERIDGSIRWTMRVFIGRDGKGRRTFVVRTFDRKTDAVAEARRLERMKDQGALTTPSKEPLSVFLKRWLDEVKEGRIRERTIHDYRDMSRRYILEPPDGLPPIGAIRLDRLTPAAFEGLYAVMWKDLGLSPRTIRYLHSILRQALGHAVLTGALPRNPTDAVRPPTRAFNGETRKRANAMSEAEADQFLAAAREDRYAALWILLLMGGLRPGEALGLAWEDVDLKEARVHVRQALTRIGVKGWKLVEPKTDRGRRVVVLPDVAVQALRRWRAEKARERLQVGAEYEDHGLVFATEWGQPLDGSNLLARNWNRIMQAAELGTWEGEGNRRHFRPAFRMYDLRHTCATLLLKRGVNPKIVSERLGHASISLTLDTYSHVLPDMQGGAAEELQAMFGTCD